MSVRVAFEAASPKFFLGPTLEAMPSLTVTLERQYALEPSRPIAFCRMRCDDLERLERTLANDGTVAGVDPIDRARTDGRARFRITRSESEVVGAYRRWVSIGGELLECRGTDGRWEIEMRFPDRGAFTRYHEFLEAHDVEFELHRLADEAHARPAESDATLTDSQREALALAFEHGFFEVPRESGLSRVAETLEISEQAVSERLRRGQARLIKEYVVTG